MIKCRWVLVFLLITLSSCVTPRPYVNNLADAVVVTAADIESLAQTVKNLCGNLEPGGPCADGAVISTDTKERLKGSLQEAQDALELANRLLAAGQAVEAGDKLDIAEAIILALKAELERGVQ